MLLAIALPVVYLICFAAAGVFVRVAFVSDPAFYLSCPHCFSAPAVFLIPAGLFAGFPWHHCHWHPVSAIPSRHQCFPVAFAVC